jgi:hypothetical protein
MSPRSRNLIIERRESSENFTERARAASSTLACKMKRRPEVIPEII